MPTITHAVIAAAGFGSRLGHGHPKCLVEFRGRTLLDRQLELLKDVPDVRIVVGFQEDSVVKAARSLRPDVTIVRNPAYASTTTLQSYALGARFLTSSCLFMDADIVFERQTFSHFLDAAASARSAPLVAYTEAKTVDAVYASITGGNVVGFSRTNRQPWEWANLAALPPHYCEGGGGAVFELLERDLPLPSFHIVSHEIDRSDDLITALKEHPVDALDAHVVAAAKVAARIQGRMPSVTA